MNLFKGASQEEWSTSEKALVGVGIGLFVIAAAITWGYQSLNAMPTATIPTPQAPTSNAFDDYVVASNGVLDYNKIASAMINYHLASSGVSSVHEYTLAEKEALVYENVASLKLLRASLNKPYTNPAIRSYLTLAPYYAKFRAMARLLVLDGQVAATHNDYKTAVNANLDALQMGIEVPHGSPFLGELVGIECQAIGRKAIWDDLDHLNANDARAAAQRLEKILKRHQVLADTLQEQKWAGQAGMLEIFQRPDWRTIFASYTGSDMSQPRLNSVFLFTSKRATFGNFTRYMDQTIANTRLPYASHPQEPARPADALSKLLLPDVDTIVFKDVCYSQTENALLLTSLALRAYRQDHGFYPDTLQALAPTYLTKVPDDPFALSGPLKYIRTGARYILYSIGPDSVDDSGKAIFDSRGSKPKNAYENDSRYWVKPESKGDIVAGINKI